MRELEDLRNAFCRSLPQGPFCSSLAPWGTRDHLGEGECLGGLDLEGVEGVVWLGGTS